MKYALIVIAVLVIGILVFLFNNGLFVRPKIESKVVGPFRLVYNQHIGEYKGTKGVMDKIYEDLLKIEISTTKGFGIYFDNPQTTPKEELRSYAGCIVEVGDYGKLSLENKPGEVMDFPKQECFVTEFPFKGPFSVLMGIIKVYPELKKYAEGNMDLPTMEVYDVPNKKIMYVAVKKELELLPAIGDTVEIDS